jgi:hypothetical protein
MIYSVKWEETDGGGNSYFVEMTTEQCATLVARLKAAEIVETFVVFEISERATPFEGLMECLDHELED